MADQYSYNHSFNYSNEQNEYTFRLRKKRRGWWWLLLLLLLPLLLLIRCQHDITVTVIDAKTKKPQPDVSITASYTSHILLQDGKFLNHKKHNYEEETNSEGKAVLKDVECCLFSYIFYGGSDITITADDLETVEESYHFTHNVTIELEVVDCEIDIVMVIDNTGSMDETMDMVKNNALNFCEDLKEECMERHRNIKALHLKVISYGDLEDSKFVISKVFSLPEDEQNYKDFVNNLELTDGGDIPESGLEALATAIQNDWHESAYRTRHVIVLYTDANTHPLDYEYETMDYYPKGMPKNFRELTKLWNNMDKDAKRLLLFAPSDSDSDEDWNRISDEWDNVSHQNLDEIISGGYKKSIEAICKSL